MPQSEEKPNTTTYPSSYRESKVLSFNELKTLIKTLAPEQLGKTKQEQTYNYTMVLLIASIASNIDSLTYCYREMLKIQQAKNGGKENAAKPDIR